MLVGAGLEATITFEDGGVDVPEEAAGGQGGGQGSDLVYSLL